MANVKFPVGRTSRVYYNTNDVLIIPTGPDNTVQVSDVQTWLDLAETVAAQKMRNLAASLDQIRVDTNTRETTAGGYQSETPVLKNAEITFDTGWDMSTTFVPKLIDAWNTDNRMAFAFLNRDKNSLTSGDILNGWSGNCWVSLSKDENADDVQRGNFTVTHADSGIWYAFTEP